MGAKKVKDFKNILFVWFGIEENFFFSPWDFENRMNVES